MPALSGGLIFKLPAFLELSNTDPFAAWFVLSGDATPDGIRVVRSVLGAISSLSIVAVGLELGPFYLVSTSDTTRWQKLTLRLGAISTFGISVSEHKLCHLPGLADENRLQSRAL